MKEARRAVTEFCIVEGDSTREIHRAKIGQFSESCGRKVSALVERDFREDSVLDKCCIAEIDRTLIEIRFEKGEPVCTILPYPRHYIGKFEPKHKIINENAKLYAQYVAWKDDREQFLADLKDPTSDAVKDGWQKTYMKGEDQFGKVFAGHQTKVRTRDFSR